MATITSLALAFVWLVFVPVWRQINNFCYNHSDLGIYGQAIANIGWGHLNPWLTGRQIRIFNDHFDPILLLAKGFELWVPSPMAGVLTETVMVLSSICPVLWLHRCGDLTYRSTILLSALLLFNVGVLDAVHFPMHPTTWAVMPMVGLGVALHKRKPKVAWVMLALLCACKEEFPFVGVMLAIALWYQKERRWALASLLLAMVWLIFVFYIRPLVFGKSNHYGQGLLNGLLESPWEYLRKHVGAQSHITHLGTALMCFLPLILWAFCRRMKTDWGLWLLLVPMVCIRFLGMAWRHHYLAPLTAGLVVACVPWLIHREIPRWVFWTTCSLLLLTNDNHLRLAVQTLSYGHSRFFSYCPNDKQRLDRIAEGIAFLNEHAVGKALLGGNLFSHVLYRSDIYVLGIGSSQPELSPYRYVFVEKPPHGSSWPVSANRLTELTEQWRRDPATQIIQDNDQVFLAVGSFIADR